VKFEILVSLALGDGFLNPTNKEKKSFLTIRHSTHQKDYIEWKYNLDKDFWRYTPRLYNNSIKSKKYYGFKLNSYSNFDCTIIRNLLYPKGKKYISREILDYLDPLGLAIWFMDDGCIDRPIGRKAMGLLNTYCNSPNAEEELIIQKYFKEKWDIHCSINKGHGKHRIRFNNENFIKLVKIIEPYIIDSLKYKINTSTRINKKEFPSLEIRSKSNRLSALTKAEDKTAPKIQSEL